MSLKKKIPLAARHIFESCLEGEMDLFRIEFGEDVQFVISDDEDLNAPNFFEFLDFELKDNEFLYSIRVSPYMNTAAGSGGKFAQADLEKVFSTWVETVKKLNEPSFLFDEPDQKDPVTERYYEEQEQFFEIVDDDAEFAPFGSQQQRLLHYTYESIIKEVREQVPNDQRKKLVDELRNDQISIGADTKAEAVSKLSRNIAKIRKMGYAIFEKVMVKMISEGATNVLPKVGGLVQDLLM